MSNNLSKFLWFIAGGLFCLALAVAAVALLFRTSTDFVLMYIHYIAAGAAFFCAAVWYKHYKNAFETLLVFITYACAVFSFVILAPLATERSLSTFIIFYTVENNAYPAVEPSETYMRSFYQKRLTDLQNGGFIRKTENQYTPTLKAKIFYTLLYPLGRQTGALDNYEKFKTEISQTGK